MKQLIVSLATILSFFFSLQVHAANTEGKSMKNFYAFMVAGAVVYAVDNGGQILELDPVTCQALGLATSLASMGYVLNDKEMMKYAFRVPIAAISVKVASSKMFEETLKNLAVIGKSFENMGDEMKGVATIALYNNMMLPVYQMVGKHIINPMLGIQHQDY